MISDASVSIQYCNRRNPGALVWGEEAPPACLKSAGQFTVTINRLSERPEL